MRINPTSPQEIRYPFQCGILLSVKMSSVLLEIFDILKQTVKITISLSQLNPAQRKKGGTKACLQTKDI